MNLVDRAKNIILKPKSEWIVIDQENTSVISLAFSYLIPLAFIPAIAAFIGYGVFGMTFFGPSINLGIKQAIITFFSTFFGAFVSAYVINTLAPNFDSTKDFSKAFKLVVFSYTPIMLAGAFQAIPVLGVLSIVGLYGLFLLYMGIKPMMKTPDDKVTIYFIVSLLVIIAVYFILITILATIFIGKNYNSIPMMR
ncbi:MAG: Yip1 family protein [Tenuifilaceae bacterium]